MKNGSHKRSKEGFKIHPFLFTIFFSQDKKNERKKMEEKFDKEKARKLAEAGKGIF